VEVGCCAGAESVKERSAKGDASSRQRAKRVMRSLRSPEYSAN
jgi:hypothetical protein